MFLVIQFAYRLNILEFIQIMYYDRGNISSLKYVDLIRELKIVNEVRNPTLKKEISRLDHEQEFPLVSDFWWYLEPLNRVE